MKADPVSYNFSNLFNARSCDFLTQPVWLETFLRGRFTWQGVPWNTLNLSLRDVLKRNPIPSCSPNSNVAALKTFAPSALFPTKFAIFQAF